MPGYAHPGYFDEWQDWDWTCPHRSWTVTGEGLAREHLAGLFERHYPKCDRKLVLASNPSRVETQRAAEAGRGAAFGQFEGVDHR